MILFVYHINLDNLLSNTSVFSFQYLVSQIKQCFVVNDISISLKGYVDKEGLHSNSYFQALHKWAAYQSSSHKA